MESPAPARTARLLSLDVLRGMTIAGMILVNNAGEDHKYEPLEHAHWNGWTPTDLIFPGFLFMVGVAMTFSFDGRLARGFSKMRLFEQVVRRSVILFCLGLIMYGFCDWRLMAPYLLTIVGLSLIFWDEPPLGLGHHPGERLRKLTGWILLIAAVTFFILDFKYFQQPHYPATAKTGPLRVPGVLQRIAVCYFLASLIVLYFGVTGRVAWTAILLVGYWWVLKHVNPPASYVSHLDPGRELARLQEWLDVKLLGSHIYSVERPEPEGILSTLPAVATTLIGVLVGNWLHTYREKRDHVLGLYFFGNLLIAAGLWWHHEFPINKKIWTSSYVLLAGGISMELLAMCYWLIDVKGKRAWAWPFLVFGTNAITVFFASGITGRIISKYVKIGSGSEAVPLASWLYHHLVAGMRHLMPNISPEATSATWAFLYVLFWFILLIPLYRRRIFIRV